jgi:replicative DNA helicase
MLRPVGEKAGPEAPESLVISALLESGRFTPEKYHLTVDDLTCWKQMWHFCVDYQNRSGSAPPPQLIAQRFPEFEPLSGINPGWAAQQLHKAATARRMRATIGQVISLLNENEVDEAYAKISELNRPRSSAKDPISIWAPPPEETDDPLRLQVPYQTLGRATGGVGAGELWYIAARPGEGKTMTLCDYVGNMLKQGVHVRYISLEMPGKTINKRVRRCMANTKELKLLDSDSRTDVLAGIESLRKRIPGRLEVIDPSHGRATSLLVREQMEYGDIVVIDHVGLMSTGDGRKAIDDWRAMAMISNQLIEDKLATGIPVLAAAQLNRTAESTSERAPKASSLSQSDALNQDGDVVVTMKRLSKTVMVHSAEKVREGEGVKWYSRFDVKRANFAEITRDQAAEYQAQDDDLAAQR